MACFGLERRGVMSNYRRIWMPGGTYFFTVNLLERHDNPLLVRHFDLLREAVIHARKRWPFYINAWVVLPDHLHCVWTLPSGYSDNANRWRVIKQHFSKSLPVTERRSAVRRTRGERGSWQRRFWARLIMDDVDYQAHIDYCHVNPLKHRLVKRVADWPYSTFHRYVEQGIYPSDWCGDVMR